MARTHSTIATAPVLDRTRCTIPGKKSAGLEKKINIPSKGEKAQWLCTNLQRGRKKPPSSEAVHPYVPPITLILGFDLGFVATCAKLTLALSALIRLAPLLWLCTDSRFRLSPGPLCREFFASSCSKFVTVASASAQLGCSEHGVKGIVVVGLAQMTGDAS